MNYTDKELLRSSQIAYYDINSNAIREVPEEYKSMCTLNTLFRYSDVFKDSIYESLSATCGFTVTENDTREKVLGSEMLKDDEAKKVAVSAVFDIIDELQSDKEGSIGSWKLVSYVFNDDIGVKGVAGKLVDGAWVTDDEFICLCRITPRRNTAGHSFARNLRKNPVSACKSQQNVVY